MIDSVLKGTGNSRFLKSAVPAGTSWADALAMLQAGTFPIDFNGINTEGFQQVGTPLNKANLLKDATAAQIGLPPSTTPDGMFQALGNTGELHVWRKTVKNAEDVPAGYTLGEVQNVTKYPITDVRSGGYTIVTKAYSNLSVDDAGNISLDESSYVNFYDDASAVRGKFIQVHSDGDILFIPNDANISTDYKTVGSVVIHNHYTDKYQSVTGYPLTPAETTTTYPVSTNPNAYQEGDDAKEAGYTLGEVVTGQFKMSERYPTDGYYYKYASSISVADNGTISLDNPSQIPLDRYNGGQSYANNCLAKIAGKFMYLSNRDSGTNAPDSKPPFNSVPSAVVYVPSDATLTWTEGGALDGFTLSKYQPVTGYPAIPAGTTIEYLGKLGDKARVQVVSYVGTGTYGESNPNSLTFDFVPKLLFVMMNKTTNTSDGPHPNANGWIHMFIWAYGVSNTRVASYNLTFEQNGKAISWYSGTDGERQCNWSGVKYTAVAIG